MKIEENFSVDKTLRILAYSLAAIGGAIELYGAEAIYYGHSLGLLVSLGGTAINIGGLKTAQTCTELIKDQRAGDPTKDYCEAVEIT